MLTIGKPALVINGLFRGTVVNVIGFSNSGQTAMIGEPGEVYNFYKGGMGFAVEDLTDDLSTPVKMETPVVFRQTLSGILSNLESAKAMLT